ncbi:MAG: apolipoprotein N-acyltransferase [Treponema sp.]|nr:apolipoprotein N-acyltransferase [Treponema sp.]
MQLKSIFNKKNFHKFLLLFASVVFFAFQHPSFIFKEGLPLLSYIALVPLFLLIDRLNWKNIWLYGFLYGFLGYSLFGYWLATFHPMGITVIAGMYGIYLLCTLPLLKFAKDMFPKFGWIAQWIVWCAYEYVKTLGFSGFHYAVTAYSHWRIIPLIQCTNIIGVWGLSAIITFFSAWIAQCIQDRSFKKHIVSGSIWLICFSTIFIYGLFSQIDYSNEEHKTVALIQQNSDPWKGGTEAYKKDLRILKSLTNQALKENSQIDFIVWPETAFIPRIFYNYQKRDNRERFDLVNDLLNYIDSKEVPFVIGNDHGVNYVDYNAVMVFEPKKNVLPPNPQMYFKMHLVPFTEYFPFDKQFPKLYELLLNGDTHMWEPGREANVLHIDNFSIGTPVCFEDTFGYIGRRFVNNGAKVLVNLSNDAWAKSLACQYQHLSMAVFRSVENRVSSVRSTSSGQTCIIDPNGKILKMAPSQTETFITGSFPVLSKNSKTVYTILGDYVGKIFTALALIIFAFAFIKLKKEKK